MRRKQAQRDPMPPEELTETATETATAPDPMPTLATEEAETARRELLRVADAMDAAREAMPEADVTPESMAHGAAVSAAMAGTYSPILPADLVPDAVAVPIRRAYLTGLLEVLTRDLRARASAWRLAIDAAMGEAGRAVDAAIAKHNEAKVNAMMGASREATEAMAHLPFGVSITHRWEAPSSVAWRAEAERLMSERTRLLGIHPAFATWDLATPEGLARVVGLARRGPFM